MAKEVKKDKKIEEEKQCCNCGEDCKCESCDSNADDLEKQIEELKNKLIYKEAELINYRRRKEEETLNLIKYASQDLILDIIKSIDNFERAFISVKNDDSNANLMIGIRMVYDELVSTLYNYGVSEIEALDMEFDHNLHNAVMTDNNSEIADNIVTEVLQKGYKYKDRVIRPAMVKVNKIN